MTNVTVSGARINWTSVPGILGYVTRYRVSPSGSWTTGTAGPTATFKNLAGLTASTTYDVQVAVSCSGYQSPFLSIVQFTIPVSKSSDVEVNMNEENQIQMYPNPAKDVLYIQVEQSTGGQVTVQINDLSGKEILSLQQQAQAGSSSIPVQLSGLSSGIYLVQVQTESGMRYISKLTKE